MALRCAQSRDWFQDRWKRETHHSLFIHHHPCIHNIFSWIPSFCRSRNIDINIRNYRQQYSLMNKLNTWIALALILPLCRALSETRRASIVTGANGYVAREVVQELMKINDGRIYCLVRPARIESESQYWSEKSDCITVMPYDMLDGGATIQQALEQASRETEQICVYHIASVFGPTEDHVQTAKDNVQGTEDLVKALAKYQNDCRLVVTSSMAAVRSTGQKPLNGEYYTDKDWNDRSKLGDNWGSSYQWSKAQSEKRAWELAEEHNLPMSSICPSFVFGPPSDGKLSSSYSITLVSQWVWGKSEVQSRLCVDVRDVAKAIVAAGTMSEAIGQRFIVSKEERVPSQEMAKALQAACRETGVGSADKITYDADFQGGAIPIGSREVEATEKLERILGVTIRPVQETISDMGRALLKEQT
jgi:cinnamoyl-CoA reductase